MSTTPAFELRVGGRVWLDGQGWEVAELTGHTVRLITDGRLRTVSVTSLIGNDPVDDDLPDSRSEDLWTVPAVVLAGLTTRQRDVLTHKLNVIRGLMEPEVGDDRSVSERYEATAAELGVTRRTLERQLARLKQHGPAGLVDVRKLREVRRSRKGGCREFTVMGASRGEGGILGEGVRQALLRDRTYKPALQAARAMVA